MYDWQATIFQAAGGGEPRLWFLTLHAPERYPAVAPTIKFTSKVAMDCVDARGNVRHGCGRALCGGHAQVRIPSLTRYRRTITTCADCTARHGSARLACLMAP